MTPTTLWLITAVGPPPCATSTLPSNLLIGREMCNVPGATCKTALQGSEKRHYFASNLQALDAVDGNCDLQLSLSLILVLVAAGLPPTDSLWPQNPSLWTTGCSTTAMPGFDVSEQSEITKGFPMDRSSGRLSSSQDFQAELSPKMVRRTHSATSIPRTAPKLRVSTCPYRMPQRLSTGS